MRIVFVGAGRLATQFAQALHEAGHDITAVYSRTMASARTLAAMVGADACDNVDSLPLTADAFIIAVTDSAIAALLPQLAKGRAGQTFFHTAGSVPLSVFEGSGMTAYGVVYPMQTFSKNRRVDFSRVHIFIEGSDNAATTLARRLCLSVSGNVSELASDRRRHLHLAAVFANNFANNCYNVAAQLLEDAGLPFGVMRPLIEETTAKVAVMHPAEAQTGPAVRYDKQVIAAQSSMLADKPLVRELYDVSSKLIHQFCTDKSEKASATANKD